MIDKLALTSSRMEVKHQLKIKPMQFSQIELPAKVSDVSKYNLRCNRNISEKMTKKDFIYDIRRPLQGTRKLEEQKQRLPIIVPTRMHKQNHLNAKIMKYSLIPNNGEIIGIGNAAVLPVPRALKFECNFCHEPIATLLSLSTHVKFHQRRYCKTCYWILEEDETMDKHVEETHQTRAGL